MIPNCVASMRATQVVEMNYAATGVVASVSLTPETITDAVTILDREGYLLEDVTASDLKEGFEITYHFSLFDGNSRLVLRLTVPHDATNVPSISGVYAGADWHERECFDFFGIQFTGHPNLHSLLLPEDFEKHPLVKDATHRKHLVDVMPDAWSLAVGLKSPEAPQPAHAHGAPSTPGAAHPAHTAHKEQPNVAHVAHSEGPNAPYMAHATETHNKAIEIGGGE